MTDKKLPKIDEALAKEVLAILSKGLVAGLGERKPGKMCVEAAVAYAMGEVHNDHPSCVERNLADLKINMNDDLRYKSNKDRTRALTRIAIAQLGTKGGRYKFDMDRFREMMQAEAVKMTNEAVKVSGNRFYEPMPFVLHDWTRFINEWARFMRRHKVFKTEWVARDNAIERVVQILKRLRTPGSKYLYLTEGKSK